MNYSFSRHVMRSRRGFSLLEFVLVLIAVSVLLGIVGTRFFALQTDAERTAVKTTVATLNRALGMRVAQFQARQDWRGLEALVGTNPMDNLERLPSNYRGVISQDGAPDPGTWYFDRRQGALVYRVRNVNRFHGGASNPPRARFAVRLTFEDRNGNGVFDRGIDAVEGAKLVALEPYRWSEH